MSHPFYLIFLLAKFPLQIFELGLQFRMLGLKLTISHRGASRDRFHLYTISIILAIKERNRLTILQLAVGLFLLLQFLDSGSVR